MMKLKELMDEIMDLAYRIDDYAESLSEEEERIMIADAGEYLRILHQLIEKARLKHSIKSRYKFVAPASFNSTLSRSFEYEP